jgi:adenylate cyclase
MTSHESSTAAPSFYDRLRNAGIEPDDSEELRLNKSLLMLATGLVSVAIMVWVTIYSILGPQFSATLPFAFQILLAGNMLFYIRTRNFDFFRVSQLGLFLFLPFVALWSGGTIISTSGVMLWALLAPVGAILCIGVNQSVGWFIAWVILTALSGAADFYLADSVFAVKSNVPIRTTIFFFALNFISVVEHHLHAAAPVDRGEAQDAAKSRRSPPAGADRTGALGKAAAQHPARRRRRAAEELEQDHRRRLRRRHRDVRRHRELHPGRGQHVAVAGIRHVEPDLLRLRRTGGTIRPGKDQDHRRRLHGGRRTQRRAARLCRRRSPTWRYPCATCCGAISSINAAHLEVRIGIGTGPIVAGVLGKKKFIYDLWGDTVNIASRITSEGVPGMIQCDTMTYHRLAGSFDFHEPQTIYLKGKGNMTVYRLIGRKGAEVSEEA